METEVLLNILKERINKSAFVNVEWDKIEDKISKDDKIIQALDYMEETEGEPNIVSYDDKNDKYIIMDTSKESQIGDLIAMMIKHYNLERKTNQKIVQ